MRPRLFPPMASFHCEQCNKQTRFLHISFVVQAIGVSRSTVYYWMEHAWIHWMELPSGRRLICEESLFHHARYRDADLHLPKKNFSESVRNCPILSNFVG